MVVVAARLLLVALLAVPVVMAGCSSKAASTSATPTLFNLPLEAQAGKGVIRGLVTDPAVRPVANVNVTLRETNQHTFTDLQGRFGFSDVAPGVHFLTASKPGYSDVQTSVEVKADDKEPPLAQVRLDAIPGTQPYFTLLKWDGFMQCSFIVGGAFGTGCLLTIVVDTGDHSRYYTALEPKPTFLQNELRWTPTQTLGTNLCTRTYASKDIGGTALGPDSCGQSPIVQAYNATRLKAAGIAEMPGIERVVYVASYFPANAAGLALNQDFTMFTHLFYNFSPPDGWTFGKDGDPPVPT